METTTLGSHHALNHLLERAVDPLFMLDKDWRFVWVNQRAEQLLLKTREELETLTLWECWPHLVGTELCNQFHIALAEQKSMHFRFDPKLDSNGSTDIAIYPSPEGILVGLTLGAEPPSLNSTATESRQEPRLTGVELAVAPSLRSEAAAEERPGQLREHAADLEERVTERTARLEETIASLESLCYNIAHDLRAPLRAMQGMSSALLEEYGASLDAGGKDYAERIIASANRMDRLIQDLLAYGRLSRFDLRCGNTDLETPIASVLSKLNQEIISRRAEVEVREPMPLVWANPTLLEQIALNLLSNALRFVKPETAPRIRVWAEEEEGIVRLWVEDNGIGIDAEYHQRIFRIFERLHADDSTFPGTGMGLAILKKATERLGGQTGVESAPGRGSRFWVELPAAKAEELS